MNKKMMKQNNSTIFSGRTGLAVEADELSYRYPDGTLALQNIHLRVKTGEKVAVTGPNGSGKSTLITLLNGVRRGNGRLKIFDIPVNKHDLTLVKQKVGLIFQNPDDQLFCPTIFEDVAFGPLNLGLSREKVEQRVKEALHNVGLNGYEQRSSFHLSYGERKLASIATVIAMQPQLIAADEPTSNLDLAHRRKIIQWFKTCRQTVVMTTHDLDMALETCDRVIVLHRGKIVADGATRQILTDQNLLERYQLELPLSLQTFQARSR